MLDYNKSSLEYLIPVGEHLLEAGPFPDFIEKDRFKLADLQERWYGSKTGLNCIFTKDLDKDETHIIDSRFGDFFIYDNKGNGHHVDLKLSNDNYQFGSIGERSIKNFIGLYFMPNKDNTTLYIIPRDIIVHMLDNDELFFYKQYIPSIQLFSGSLYPYIDKGYVLKFER